MQHRVRKRISDTSVYTDVFVGDSFFNNPYQIGLHRDRDLKGKKELDFVWTGS